MLTPTRQFLPHLIDSIEEDSSWLRIDGSAIEPIHDPSNDRDQAIINNEGRTNDVAREEWPQRSKQHTPQKISCNAVTSEQLRQALVMANYNLKQVQCSVDDITVHLFGFVNCYFELQMATKIARHFAEGRRIDLQIDVESMPYNF